MAGLSTRRATLAQETGPSSYVPKVRKHEESLQRMIARYLRMQYPQVNFFSDYAAGVKLSMNQAVVRKSLQSGKGWPDMFIAWPTTVKTKDGSTKHCCGLFIELKKEGTTIYATKGPRKGKLVSNEHIQHQAGVLNSLNAAGYCAVFGVGFDQTVKIIDWYMGKPENALLF